MDQNRSTDDGERQMASTTQREAASATQVTSDRRRAVRADTDHSAHVRLECVSYKVEVCNVSRGGAQIRIRQGLVPAVGQVVTIEFLDGQWLDARVAWTSGTEVGLEFATELADHLDVVHFDDLGAEFYRAVLRLQNDK
jgi:hypothetical protein